MCDLETSRIGAPYIYDISRLRVKPGAQNVKVSFAKRVMSSAVGAGINTLVRIGKDNSTVSLNDTGAYQRWCYVVQLFM